MNAFAKLTSERNSAPRRAGKGRAAALFNVGLLISFLLALTACTSSAPQISPSTPTTVRIVSSFPLKGKLAAQSKLMNEAIDLAIQQRKPSLGLWSVQHLTLDDSDSETGDWARNQEEANARLAANDPSVIAYIGPYNSAATAISLPITNRARLLQLGPTVTWPGLTQPGWNAGEPAAYYPTGQRTFARLMPTDAQEARAAARWAAQTGIKSVLVLQDGSVYSEGLAREFMSATRSMGVQVPGNSLFDGLSQSARLPYRGPGAPEAIFYAPSAVSSAVSLARALRSENYSTTKTLVSDTALNDQFLSAVGSQAANWRIIFNGVAGPEQNPGWQRFASAFQAAYGAEPSQFAANAYDATNLALDALQAIGKRDREAIARRVPATRDYSGASGQITFDAAGDRTGGIFSVYKIEGGAFALDKTIAP